MELKGLIRGESLRDNTFIKILPANETCNGFTYHDGVNEDMLPFNADTTCNCGPGGLYFTDPKHLVYYTSNTDRYVRFVYIPGNEDVVILKSKARAHKIICGPRMDLYKVSTWAFINKRTKIKLGAGDDLTKRAIVYALNQAKSVQLVDWIITNCKSEYGTEMHKELLIHTFEYANAYTCKNMDVIHLLFDKFQLSDVLEANDWDSLASPVIGAGDVDLLEFIINKLADSECGRQGKTIDFNMFVGAHSIAYTIDMVKCLVERCNVDPEAFIQGSMLPLSTRFIHEKRKNMLINTSVGDDDEMYEETMEILRYLLDKGASKVHILTWAIEKGICRLMDKVEKEICPFDDFIEEFQKEYTEPEYISKIENMAYTPSDDIVQWIRSHDIDENTAEKILHWQNSKYNIYKRATGCLRLKTLNSLYGLTGEYVHPDSDNACENAEEMESETE